MKNIAAQLHEATALLKRRFEKIARPHKLTLTQWRVLGVLSKSCAVRQVELGEAVKASPMTISDVLERLEAAGLVQREAAPEDSRAKNVELTEEGQKKVEHMRELANSVFADAFRGIPEEDLDALRRTLPRIIENLGETEPREQETGE